MKQNPDVDPKQADDEKRREHARCEHDNRLPVLIEPTFALRGGSFLGADDLSLGCCAHPDDNMRFTVQGFGEPAKRDCSREASMADVEDPAVNLGKTDGSIVAALLTIFGEKSGTEIFEHDALQSGKSV